MAPRWVDGMLREAEVLEARLKKPNVGFGGVGLSVRLIEVLLEVGTRYCGEGLLGEAKEVLGKGEWLVDSPPIWFTLREGERWKFKTLVTTRLAEISEKAGNLLEARDELTSAAEECLQRSAELKLQGKDKASSIPAANALLLLNKKARMPGARPASARLNTKLAHTAKRYTTTTAPPQPAHHYAPPSLPKLSPAPPTIKAKTVPIRHRLKTPVDIQESAAAALRIQTAWRVCSARWHTDQRKRDYGMYRKQRNQWEAMSIQQHLRSMTKQKPCNMPSKHVRGSGVSRIQAARRIQACYRMYAAQKTVSQLRLVYYHALCDLHTEERAEVDRRRTAAVMIQRMLRMYFAKRVALSRRAAYRSYIRALHRDPHEAASVIQSIVRMHFARGAYLSRHRAYKEYRAAGIRDEAAVWEKCFCAAVVIQRSCRRWQAARRSRVASDRYRQRRLEDVARERDAHVVLIQSIVRMFLARRFAVSRLREVAAATKQRVQCEGSSGHVVVIQRAVRGHLARRVFQHRMAVYESTTSKRLHAEGEYKAHAAVVIQRAARGWLARQEIMMCRKQYNSSTRGRVLRENPTVAVVRIQSWWRGIGAKKVLRYRLHVYDTYITERDLRYTCCVKIQAAWRMWAAQAVARRRLAQYREYILWETRNERLAAVKIQSVWRGVLARKVLRQRLARYKEYAVDIVNGVDRRSDAAAAIQRSWRGWAGRQLLVHRACTYKERVRSRIKWEGDNVVEAEGRASLLRLCKESPSDTVYSEEWEVKMWNDLQEGEITLKEYLGRVRRVVGPPSVIEPSSPQTPAGSSFRRNRQAATPVPHGVVPLSPMQPLERPRTTPSRPPRLDASVVCPKIGKVPPSWVSAECSPRTPEGPARLLQWDEVSLPGNVEISDDLTTVWKTSHRDAIVVSRQTFRGEFCFGWKVGSGRGETLVGVVPYGEPGVRMGMVYRHTDGCLKKHNTMKTVGRAAPAEVGDEMQFGVGPHGAYIAKNGEVVWQQSPMEMQGAGIGRPEGVFLVCAIFYGVPGATVALLPSACDTSFYQAAVSIQRTWRTHRATSQTQYLKSAYRTYLNLLHQAETRGLAGPSPDDARRLVFV